MGKETDITLDFMKKEDLDQVMAIEQDSFSMPWSRNLFLAEFRSPAVSTLMVALSKAPRRIIVGYLIFWLVADEMHILNLAVAPSFRRQGIARKIVIAGVKHAHRKGVKKAFLEVRASNEAAKRLYSDIGFTGTAVRRDYYDGPIEDAVVMTLGEGAFENLSRSEDNR